MTYCISVTNSAVNLTSVYLSSIPFFARSTVKTHLSEFINLLQKATEINGMMTFEKRIHDVDCAATCYKTPSMTICIVVNRTFNQVAVRSIISELKQLIAGQNTPITQAMLDKFIKESQEPKKDTVNKIHDKMDEIKTIMIQNIDDILARGENLESLAAKSKELEEHGIILVDKTKKLNRCCILL
jgi:hypothetical protein